MSIFLIESSRLVSFVMILNLFSQSLGAFQQGMCWKDGV